VKSMEAEAEDARTERDEAEGTLLGRIDELETAAAAHATDSTALRRSLQENHAARTAAETEASMSRS